MKLSTHILAALLLLVFAFDGLAQDRDAEDLINLEVDSAGIYEVTHEQLINEAGLDIAGQALSRIALMHRGQAVQLELVGSDADDQVFGPGASLRFAAKKLNTLYTDINVYTLRLDSALHRSIQSEAIPRSPRVPYATSYLARKSYAPQTAYSFASPDKNDPWFAKRLLALRKPAEETVSIMLDDMIPGGNTGSVVPQLTVDVWGGTDLPGTLDDHHVRIELNDLTVMDETFDGFEQKKMSTQLSNVRVGRNDVVIKLPLDQGYDYEALHVNSIEIKYPRAFVAQEDRLSFTSAAGKFRVRGFTSKDIAVYRLNANGLTTKLVAAEALGRCNASSPRCGVRFSGGVGVSSYHVVTPNSVKKPVLSFLPVPQDIKSGSAEYLIITHPDFIAETGEADLLGGLAQNLRERFDSVDIVDVDQIYAQFGDHIFDPQAIRDYIKFSHQNRGTKMVLLVGGDIYDYKGFENRDAQSFIPSIYTSTDTLINFAPVDAKYVDLNDDNVPNLPLGRLPVRSMAELNVLLDKRSAYLSRDYRQTALFVADSFDQLGQYSFKLDALSIKDDYFSNWAVDTAFVDDLTPFNTRRTISRGINQGVSLTSFFGHSSTSQWTFDGVFNSFDAASLSNRDKPTIVTQWGCWNTYYVNPNEDSMGHRFMMEGNRGAVAVMGATTLTSATNEKILSRLVFDRLTKGQTLGRAITDAKSEYVEKRGSSLDVILGWTLLGFPELTL